MSDILLKIQEMGFDGAVSIPKDEVKTILMKHANRSNSDVGDALKMIEDAAAVLVLTYPFHTFHDYPENEPHVSGYYYHLQDSYVAAEKLSHLINKNGNSALLTYGLPQKPLGEAADLGRFGRNNLLIRSGPHIAIQTLICQRDTGLNWITYKAGIDNCDKCRRCEDACPSGALKDRHYTRSKCLRAYMGNKDAPDEIVSVMGERLLGCDECLNSCPGKKTTDVPHEWKKIFSWENILDNKRLEELKPTLGCMVGPYFAMELGNSPLRCKNR